MANPPRPVWMGSAIAHDAAKLPERTILSPGQERVFQLWLRSLGVNDADRSPYDYRGAFLANVRPQVHPADNQPHWPDTFKQHGHPSFSEESRYSRFPGDGGRWQDSGAKSERFIPPPKQVGLLEMLQQMLGR